MKRVWLIFGPLVFGALIGCAEPDATNTEAITPGASAPDGAFEAGTDAPSDNLAPQDGADVPVDSDPDVTIPRDGDVVLPPDADADDAAPDGDDVMADRLDVPPTPDVPTDSDAATSPDADVPSTPDADARADVPADTTMLCPSGLTRCGASCVDLQGDNTNCGRCGTVCATNPNAAPTCSAGACANACRPGFGDCDGNVLNGCEANTNTSAQHCGRCGLACLSGICNGSAVCEPLILPVFELVYNRPEITGVSVRVVNSRSPNYVGSFVDEPCLPSISTGRRSCRIDLRRLQIPDGDVPSGRFTSTADWRGGYGLEVILRGVGGLTVCTGSDCRLPGGFVCGAGTAFSCVSILCNAGAPPMNVALVRYEEMYRSAGYGLRIAGSDTGLRVCSEL